MNLEKIWVTIFQDFLNIVESFIQFFSWNINPRALQLALGSTVDFFKSWYGRLQELDEHDEDFKPWYDENMKIQVSIWRGLEELEDAKLSQPWIFKKIRDMCLVSLVQRPLFIAIGWRRTRKHIHHLTSLPRHTVI